ncbi:unnamed protein product [Closterium sp. Naga37s-1]|nr:unnamed protein product [Closterium sp. Naga37s-1]
MTEPAALSEIIDHSEDNSGGEAAACAPAARMWRWVWSRRDVLLMSTAFLFFFVAFNALQNVATSIHGASNIGALSMGVLYAVIVVTAPLAPFPIRFWRARAAILVAQTGFWAFIGSNAFTIDADFTRYVVQPLLGAQWMGGAMMVFGVAIAVCCFIAVRFAKGLSSIRLMLLLGAASQTAVLILTWLFQDRAMSKPAAFALVFSCALLWGIGATAFQSQITALLPLVFPSDVDAAYAHWISWSSAACSAYFLASPYIATPIKNSLLLVVCPLSVILAAVAVKIRPPGQATLCEGV